VTSSERVRTRRRKAPLVGLALLAGLAVVVVRVAVDSRAALREGVAAQARGDSAEAVRRYLDAARLYLPGSPWVSAALDRLDGMAGAAERGHDPTTARHALEAMRAAILGTRSFYTPSIARLAMIDERLARIYAVTEDPRVDPGASAETRFAWHAARLARRPGPVLGFALAALIGLGMWLGAAVGFVRGGLDASLRLRRTPAITMGVLFVLGMALFLAGLRLA
jgi:hypothetical protein